MKFCKRSYFTLPFIKFTKIILFRQQPSPSPLISLDFRLRIPSSLHLSQLSLLVLSWPCIVQPKGLHLCYNLDNTGVCSSPSHLDLQRVC
ncbi:hypothetical protein QYF36_012032 [Acer negundo]|nr:hypothetical protein QYF36_012032 [Acer negundo]